MGKLFSALLIAAPLSAVAVWAYLHQTQMTETRMDLHELRFQIERAEFDIAFDRNWGREPDPYKLERLERNRELLSQLEQERLLQRGRLDQAVATIDAELEAYEDRPAVDNLTPELHPADE